MLGVSDNVTVLVSDQGALTSPRGPRGTVRAVKADNRSPGSVDQRMDPAVGEPLGFRATHQFRSVLASGVRQAVRTCRVIRDSSALAVDRLVEHLLGVPLVDRQWADDAFSVQTIQSTGAPHDRYFHDRRALGDRRRRERRFADDLVGTKVKARDERRWPGRVPASTSR